MKKFLGSVVLAGLLVTFLSAENYYVGLDYSKGNVKYYFSNDHSASFMDNSFSAIEFNVGIINSSNNRYELYYNSLDFTNSLGVDYILTFNSDTFTPYIGGGISYNIFEGSSPNVNGIGFKLRGGLIYNIDKNLEANADINYNYIHWETLYNDYVDISFNTTHFGIGLGLKYKF